MMNSYEVGTVVVTFYTTISRSDYSQVKVAGNSSPLADYAKLAAISIADNGYAESEWGERVTILHTRGSIGNKSCQSIAHRALEVFWTKHVSGNRCLVYLNEWSPWADDAPLESHRNAKPPTPYVFNSATISAAISRARSSSPGRKLIAPTRACPPPP